ncbi:MAG: pectinesterase family protein [Prevotellaceae bacterium]|nr:pectinesterase family protein [Prevotellaceae bacterium]
MKKVITLLCVLFMCCLYVSAASPVVDKPITIKWAFNTGTDGQVAVISEPDYISTDYVSVGSGLSYAGTKSVTEDNVTYVQTGFQPANQDGSAAETNAVKFMFKTKTGITFTPTKVSFRTYRHGTDGGKLDVAWQSGETSKTLATAIVPMRNNTTSSKDYDTAKSYWETTSVGVDAYEGESGLAIYLYSLGNTKQVSYGDITIEGVLNGEIADVKTYALTTNVNPSDAGTVTTKPVGQVFDEGTEITLTQTRNFGYKFRNWTDKDGNVLGADDTYTFIINKDEEITANYDVIPTYQLTVEATNGAKEYMVTPDPAPEIVGQKNMYEEGTTVTLSASNNPILTFASWNNGETSGNIQVVMDADKTVTANYNAIDFIAGWDFYVSGNNGRVADFAAEDNDADALILRNADGTTTSWLDKSQMAASGYEGKPAAVNWKALTDKYYYQTKVNASAFTDITVQAEMLYNYNAYQTQILEYSLDNKTWYEVSRITIDGVKKWTPIVGTLPAECNNKSEVYLRWIPDYTSKIDGTSATNDGTSITAIYVTGKARPVDDGKEPELVSSVPEADAENASIAGKIVLNFSEKVVLADGAYAMLNNEKIEGTATNQTVTFAYKGLDYDDSYTFILPANSVLDLMGNPCTKAVVINFTTKSRSAVTKGKYDFIVPDMGTFKEAIAAANKRTDKSVRYRIFVKQGDYLVEGDDGAKVTGYSGETYPSPTTTVSAPNVSIIGEGMDNTQLRNQCDNWADIESLHRAEFVYLTTAANNTYVQDITFRSGHKLGDGRCAALEDYGNKNIFKNFRMWGTQDTYYSRNGRMYFETSALHGSVDYLCGGGDVVYNQCDLVIERDGSVLCAPAQARKYGYVFIDCTVKSANPSQYKNYTLGRPWGSGTPAAIYINTTMDVVASAAGWDEMSGGYPLRFAEYGTKTTSGTLIDLSQRKTVFGDGHTNNPILSAEEAKQYTVTNVLGGDDDWNPQYYTEQAPVPSNVVLEGSSLTWDNSDYVFCWAVCKDGYVVDFTTTPNYTIDLPNRCTWSVRAANEMGGLGEAVEATVADGIEDVNTEKASSATYDIRGYKVASPHKGQVYIQNSKKYISSQGR